MDRAGLNSHWAFTEGKEPRTGDADREQAILDLLRNLGVIDVPDTLVAARAYALLHIDSHAAPLELTDMTDRQVEDLVLEEGLTGAVLSLATSPLDLADVLALFDEALVNRFGLDDIVTRFAGLAMAHTEEAAQLRQSFPARGSALTDVLVGLRKESLEPNQLKKLEFTYRRILRGWMDQDSEAALTWITDRLETVPETLKPLFQNLHTYFLGITSDFQTPSTLRTKPYFYQKEAIRYFSMPEHRRGILADEPGMGKSIQAMGVAEATGAKKILWVTTNSNKQTVAEELAKHRQGYDPAKVPSDVIILSGDADILAQQLRNLDGKKYVIVNYEALRNLRTNNPVGYAALKADLDMIILDEAQLVDNRDSDQGKALHALVEEAGAENEDLRLLMASATPVQNRFDRYYNQLSLIDPTEFPATHSGWRNFKARYVDRGAEGLLELHHLLQNYQLRRRKAEVFPEADPTVGLNLQPTALPKKIYSTVEYDMSKEQSELYVMAMGDFDVFVERHEAALFPKLMTDPNALEEKKIKVKTSIFSKLRVLFQILTHPSKFGVTENPRMDELKRRVTGALLKGEKPIVWSHHQEVGDEIGQAMADLSVQLKSDHPALFPEGFETGRFDGSPISKSMVQWNGQDMLRRDKDRNGFQESETSQPRVMNPSLEAGGVGLTLTAGNPSFFYELPLMVTRLIQGEDRNHRVDGRFRRHTLEYNTLIGRLHPEVMARLHKSDPGLHDLLARDGTVEENLHGNLEIMRRQYSLVLDGLASEADLSRAMQKKLLGAVRYTKVDRVVSTRAEPEKDLSELTDEDLEALTDLEGLSEENVEENAGEAASLEMVIAGQFAPGNTAKLLVPRVR